MRYILASAPPRREELLKKTGISFEIIPSSIEEKITKTVPSDIVMELAAQKAHAVFRAFRPSRTDSRTSGKSSEGLTVIGADTIVVYRGEILGKPADKSEAYDMLSMLSDRTQERQMYEALGEALHTAKAANEAKSNFLSNMSHDIRTPMNAIVGFSVLLGRDAEHPEKVREYTRKISSSSQHLLNLINDILDMSKIESGKTSLNVSEFSGPQAVALAERAAAQGRPFHLILLDWRLPGMDGLEAARRIRRTAGPQPPLLVLTSFDLDEARHAGQSMEIDLFLPKPFFLSRLQRAAAQLLEPEPGPQEAPEQEEASLEGLRILAAEDNEINAEILVELLEMEGAACQVVPNGREAVSRFAASQPGEFDMIFMDVQMPVMDGYDATRAIRGSGHPLADVIPIIAMTANAFEEDVQTALAAGMDAHTAKPIDMSRLRAVISRLRRPGYARVQP